MEKRRNMNQKVDQKRIPRLKQKEKKKEKDGKYMKTFFPIQYMCNWRARRKKRKWDKSNILKDNR